MADVTTTTESPAASTRPADSPRSKAPRRGRRTLIRAIVFLIALAAVAAGSFYAWKYFSAYEDTDDAQVDGNINAISARINGYVVDVPTDNERYVKAGDVLARIDPKDYTVALAQAEADLAAAEASFQGYRTDVPVTSTTTSSQLTSTRSGKVDAVAALAGRPAPVERGPVASDYGPGQRARSRGNVQEECGRRGSVQNAGGQG